MARFVIRDAMPGDMSALRDVFRGSSLSNQGDRLNLVARPGALGLSGLAVPEGRTRTAVADGGIVGFATWRAASATCPHHPPAAIGDEAGRIRDALCSARTCRSPGVGPSLMGARLMLWAEPGSPRGGL